MTLRYARLWLATGIVFAVPGLPAQNPPQPRLAPPLVPSAPAESKINAKNPDIVDSFKLSDGDIDAVLGALEQYTGRTIVRPGSLPTASYSLIINRPIPKAELVTALETILALNQVSVSPMGDRFLKVTPLATAKSEAPEMITGSSLDLPPSGRIVTKLFELNFLRVSEFAPQIQVLMTPGIGGGPVQLEKANVMLVTDTLENVQRIERLLLEVDRPREESLNPRFYPLHNAKASDLVTKIHSMLSGPVQTQLRATTNYTADDRTNQLIVIADPREYPLFDSLVAQLDIKSDPNTRNEVIYLKHADAKDLAAILSQIISGQNAATQKAGGPQTKLPGAQPAPATPGQPAATATATAGIESLTGTGSTEFSTMVTIQPDERTNSIVVSGNGDDLRLIRSIVDKLDILLAQVRIEVVIAEVTFSDTSNTGINTSSSSGPVVTVGTAPNGGTSVTSVTGAVAGLSVAPLSSLVTAATTGTTASTTPLSMFNPIQAVATLSSLGAISKTKILQESTIVTTHNKEATITVTDELPVITGVSAEPLATGSTVATTSFAQSSSVSYKDIGITLKVTPLIGDDGSIQLKVDQTVDDQGTPVIIDGNSQPQINHREATSFVNVMDDQMVVLGGFQSSSKQISRQRFGILFEIPILSNLLGYRSNDTERTELLLFLRPHVIKDAGGTPDTNRAIDGMGNKEQIHHYLNDPKRIPDADMSLKERLQ
jgi:general secretion pathway protein D